MDRPWAVIASRYGGGPLDWIVAQLTRETAKCVYRRRWAGETRVSKDDLRGRFDSEAQAAEFKARAVEAWNSARAAVADAEAALRAAEVRAAEARREMLAPFSAALAKARAAQWQAVKEATAGNSTGANPRAAAQQAGSEQ